MRLFRKNYCIDLNQTSINLEHLGIDSLEQVYHLEMPAFRISSLGLFNEVTAKFEKPTFSNQLLLKIELPKKFYNLQLIAIAILVLFCLGGVLKGEFNAIYVTCIIPIFLTVIGLWYQRDFLNESTIFFNEITKKNVN